MLFESFSLLTDNERPALLSYQLYKRCNSFILSYCSYLKLKHHYLLDIISFRRKTNRFCAIVHFEFYANSALHSQPITAVCCPVRGTKRWHCVIPSAEGALFSCRAGITAENSHQDKQWSPMDTWCADERWVSTDTSEIKLRLEKTRRKIRPNKTGGGCAVPKLAATQEHCAAAGRKWSCCKANASCIWQLSSFHTEAVRYVTCIYTFFL